VPEKKKLFKAYLSVAYFYFAGEDYIPGVFMKKLLKKY